MAKKQNKNDYTSKKENTKMTRRKVFIAFAAAVMILVLTAALFVACDQTKTYTVTFKDGDTVVKTVSVKDGATIADADLPADPTKDGAVFEGWFDGDKAFDKTAAITSDATYLAKWTSLFTVTFKNGDTVIATATVKDGEKIADADIPADPEDEKFAFVGWFVGDAAYDSSAAVTENIVVDAKFSTFFKSYIGTWHGATSDWDPIAYTVVVDANSISVTIGSAEAQVATSIEVDKDGTVMFKLGETDYMLYAYYDGNLHIIDTAEIALSAELAGRVHVSSSDIVGTYTTEGGHTIVINKTFAKVDGILGTSFYYDGRSSYTWANGDKSSSLAYNASANAWIYKEDVSSDADKLIVPELAAIDIPAEFIGNWYGTFESFGSTSYFLVKVTADGVFAYNPGSGFAKVGVATEYKDGKLTVVGLDETITASIADGKLAYKSDAEYGADYQLEKGTVVVFENNYSVFYIAKLGADNKIDQSTFALEDPQMKAGYTFKGWLSDLDNVTEFDESATFADSAVFVGSSEKTGYVVTFKKTSSDSNPVIAVVEMTNGKLAADQIPAALTYEDGSVFAGWFTSAGVKATADLAITADTTFTALAVKESDYAGYWINTTSGKEALAVIADGKVSFEKLARNVAYTYEDGCLKFTVKDRYSIPYNYVISKTNIGITITESYYDPSAEVYVDNIYQLTAATTTTTTKRYAGTYKSGNKDNDVITVLENGIVTTVNGSETVYGYISGSSSSVKLAYKAVSDSKVYTKTGKYDAKSLILGNTIYVKNPTSVCSYFNSDYGTMYEFVREGKTTLYTYKATDYATVVGELAVGNIVTVTYGDKSFVAKITSATEYDVAGAECGTFTAEGKDSIAFDGFGAATIGDKTYSYAINGKGIAVLTGDTTLGVTLDSEAKTYAEVASDGFVHTYINASNDKYTMVFDGFGGATLTYSSYVYSGTYTLGTGTVTIAKINYDYNKTYTIEESGNVLASTDGKTALAVKGYVVVNRLNEMNGFWQSADKAHSIEIIVKSEKKIFIKIDQSSVYFADGINYNGTKIMFRDDNLKNYCIDRTATGISMSDIAYGSATQTFDVDTTKIVGQWELFGDVYYVKCVFNADGKVDVTRMSAFGPTKDTVAYTSEANVYTFTFKNTKYTCTLKADGSLDVSTLGTARKIADPEVSGGTPEETLDAFAGTWSGKVGVINMTVVCDGKGNMTINGDAFTYTKGSETIVIENGDIVYTFKISGEKIHVEYEYDGNMSSGDLTKQA